MNLALSIFALDIGKANKSFAVPSEYSLPNNQLATKPKIKTPPIPTAWDNKLRNDCQLASKENLQPSI